MRVIFQGMESATHRETLASVTDLFEERPVLVGSWSWVGLKNRRRSVASIKDDVEGYGPMSVLEGGVFTTPMSRGEALKARSEYYRLLEEVPFDLAVEFDHPTLQDDHEMPDDPRIIPVRHEANHLDAESLLENVGSLALPQKQVSDLVVPVLRRHAKDCTVLALGSADLAECRTTGFNAAMVSSWFAPGKYGEISVWDGGRFVRANSNERARVLRRMSAVLERNGFDTGLLDRKDARESDRLAAWSLLRWADSLAERSDQSLVATAGSGETAEGASAPIAIRGERKQRTQKPLPGFTAVSEPVVEETEDGVVVRRRGSVANSGETVRSCDSCFLSSTCPAYEQASSCAYNFPVEVRSEDDMKSLMMGMLELQATRVAFARFAEEVNGGYPDPAVGTEMDRLFRMGEKIAKQNQRRERLTFSVESESSGGTPAAGGVLSQIFGPKAQPQVEAQPADPIIAEIVEIEEPPVEAD